MARSNACLWTTGIVVAICSAASGASAATNCVFTSTANRLSLANDCQTDATLFIPEGFTLDGRGHRITAVDPQGGSFTGAIVRNAGTHASVRNLTLDTRALTSVCHPAQSPDQRLRGILLEGASGTISDNRVLDVDQGSGCQEGNGIEVRNAPFDGTHPGTQRVTIAGNYVAAYQKTGILVNGDVRADVTNNRVIGQGPIDRIAQNGIQLGFGAYGRVRANSVSDNLYVPGTVSSSGILLLEAGENVDVTANDVEDNDVGIYLVSTSGASLTANRVSSSTTDGITIDGIDGLAQDNRIVANILEGNALGIDLAGEGANLNRAERNVLRDHALAGVQIAFGADDNSLLKNDVQDSGQYGLWIGTSDNTVGGNRIRRTHGVGVHVEGSGNELRRNVVVESGTIDVENDGDNAYGNNRCDSSTGAPVDCP